MTGATHDPKQPKGEQPSFGIEGKVHPDFAVAQFVPSWAVPARVQWAASLVLAVGGVLLGIALTPEVEPYKLEPAVLVEVAKACVADASKCPFVLPSPSTGVHRLAIGFVGALLLFVHGILVVRTKDKNKSKSPASTRDVA